MTYVVRADASQLIGAGHVMRSSAIAEELISRGEKVTFVGEILNMPWLDIRIRDLGFSQIISTPKEFSSNPSQDILILDSYYLPIKDPFIQYQKWKAVVALVDDITPEYRADLYVHPGLSSRWRKITNAKVLAGHQYIPFRKAITKIDSSDLNTSILQIFVVGGGADSFNFAGAVCSSLVGIKKDFSVNIFTNSTQFESLDDRFRVFPIGSKLDELAAKAELVFTTASTTSLEFIARGVAIGIGCAVQNQEDYYQTLSNYEVAVPVGRYIDSEWDISHANIAKLVHSEVIRETLRTKCAGLIDLNGAKRIVDEISII
jgi:spore coat polysaccharide biosynthesis predicted glycosyltransferase SpsG